MAYSLLDQNSISAINDCNGYLEGFFQGKLKAEYDEDVSEKIGEDLESKDIKQFYFYSLYCWRVFYFMHERYLGELDSILKNKINRMGGDNVSLNKEFAERDLPHFTYYVADLLIAYTIMNGKIATPIEKNRTSYMKNLYKIKEFAPYIDKVLKKSSITINFERLSYVSSFLVLKDFVENYNVSTVFETIKKINNNNINIEQMLEKQEKLKDEVNKIESRLNGYRGEYNFVEISSAFAKLRSNKKKEQRKSTRNYWVCMFALMAFPIFAIYSHWGKVNFEWSELFMYIPMVTLEVLFLYFMRIFYVESKGINSQILQIDLRLSLCEFIQGYVKYRKENRDSEEVLKSFETLIFSPIQASGDNIPSVLDGANVLAELAGNILKAREK